MVSGTPMITTKLAGMPLEYYEHVYFFDDESVDGMNHSLNSILSEAKETLHEFGSKAKKFVIQNKNNKKQSERILNFVDNDLQ